ncbi:MAG: serine protease [Nitrospira sp.]|nr:trypsin-like peptidase domain-containing protein [Nitrospira sp.]
MNPSSEMAWSRRYSTGLLRVMMGLTLATGGSVSPGQAVELSPAQIYASAAPAVVFIVAVGAEGMGQGTGSIIETTGLVLTNAHVVWDKSSEAPAKKIFVFLKPDRVIGNESNQENLTKRYQASVMAYDKDLDLALIKMTNVNETLPVLPFADPSAITIGSRVVAIGHPESGGLWSLTTGVISAEWKNFTNVSGKDIFQTETSLNRGNSGGPLIDLQGHQVGVNSMIARKSKDGLAITSVNFAIKSNVAKDWMGKQGVQVAYAAHPMPTEPMRPVEPERFTTAPAPVADPPASDGGKQTDRERPMAMIPLKPQPKTVLENQPEAKPETGPGLPAVRPFSLDRLMKGLNLVQKDLESQMDDMQAEIRKRRR